MPYSRYFGIPLLTLLAVAVSLLLLPVKPSSATSIKRAIEITPVASNVSPL
jgi:hypothetical protein